MSSSVIKIILMVVGVLSLIGSIIIGAVIADVPGGFIGAVAGFFSMVFAFGFGNLLEDAESIDQNIQMIVRMKERAQNSSGNDTPIKSYSLLDMSDKGSRSGDHMWRCPDCGKSNPNSSRVCKDCGYQK